jgi:hypothetical protein
MPLQGPRPTQNFIENAVRSLRTAVKVSTFHFNALTNQQADPVVAAMLATYGPHHQVLVNIASEKDLDKGALRGRTQTLEQLFADLIKTDLPAWQQDIRNTYAEGTAGWTTLFPNDNYPFNSGTIQSKIGAVLTLRNACNGDANAAIQAVGVTVGTFYTALLTARSLQSGKKTEIIADISAADTAIKNMCIAQFGNYGGLIQKFASTPSTVEAFIDFATLSSSAHSSLYTGTANPSQKKKICTHRFAPVSTIVVTNDGTTVFKLWIAESAKSTVHPAGVTVAAGSTSIVIQAVNLGNPTHRILMLENLDPAANAAYEIYVGTKNSDPLTDPHD